MEKFYELYSKALSSTNSQKLPESINDLLVKDLNDENLTEQQKRALHNYYKFRTQLLASATDDTDFSNKVKKLRTIANFSDWKEFLNEL
ncbi:MAG: hypothetical protein KatS3mg027_1568 [Bacteroidia bacterium]|nr:MAG: hypothetical protein KatS3mg027_1568 [Bacteroidia bacterium]